ncbi:MAG: hypothetical protein Q8R26_00890 [bacterium]|nr:hypothetical protein [bacterium]
MEQILHEVLEQDLGRLSREVQQERAGASVSLSDRDVVKKVIGKHIEAQQTPQAPTTQPSQILPQYLQKESADVQLKIEELIDHAFHKGITASITEAQKYGPFILDGFHDSLTAKVYEALKEKGIVS